MRSKRIFREWLWPHGLLGCLPYAEWPLAEFEKFEKVKIVEWLVLKQSFPHKMSPSAWCYSHWWSLCYSHTSSRCYNLLLLADSWSTENLMMRPIVFHQKTNSSMITLVVTKVGQNVKRGTSLKFEPGHEVFVPFAEFVAFDGEVPDGEVLFKWRRQPRRFARLRRFAIFRLRFRSNFLCWFSSFGNFGNFLKVN